MGNKPVEDAKARISSIYEIDHPDVDIPYNIIISKLTDPMKIVEEFDFGLCQIGMTTDGKLLMTEAFLTDINNKTITVINSREEPRQIKRIKRMKEKFPDFTVIAKNTTGVLDADGVEVCIGDSVSFCYGIPPIGVTAPVIMQDDDVWVATPEHLPKRCRLTKLKEYVGDFYIDRTNSDE